MPGPHDALFHATFSKLENARAELRRALPEALVHMIDFDTLQIRGSRFIDENLRGSESDLLYSAQVAGAEALIYVLVEHQSHVDHAMPFRLLRYMAKAWEHYVKNVPVGTPAPPIVPVVLHHSASGWTAPTRLRELLALPEQVADALDPHVPDFRFVLHDLAREDLDALRDAPLPPQVRLVLFLLQRSRENAALDRELEPWTEVARQLARDALATVLSYIVEASELAPEEIRAWAGRVSVEAEEEAVTAAEKLRTEGEVNLLLKLLTHLFGALPPHVEQRVRNASTEELERWALAAPRAQSLAEVFGPSNEL